MAFNIVVNVTAQGTEKIDQTTEKLDDATAAAKQTTDTLTKLGPAAAQAGKQAAEGLDATATAASRARGDLDALNAITGKLQAETRALAGVSSQQTAEWERMLAAGKASADRQAEILERIHGPMRQYEADVQALNALLEKGQIDLADYNREMARAEKQAGRGLGPVQGPRPASVVAAEEGNASGLLQAIAPQFGQAGNLLSQFASGGMIAAAGTTALGIEIVRLSDEYTTLSNKVERFTNSGQSANEILHEQFDMSIQLRSSLAATEQLYARVRESTTELNLSTRQQVGLAHDIGVAVVSEGKSAEDAAALTRRLGLAFETGAISGRELRSIMREYPEIANAFAETLGHSRAELLQMANKGQISAEQLIEAFRRIAPEAEKTLDRMPQTVGGIMGHVKDRVVLAVGDIRGAIADAFSGGAASGSEALDRAARTAAELARQRRQELEQNARTGGIIDAARSIGIDLGPYSKAAADSVTEARMAARAAGIDIADAFAGAKDKARLYSAEIDKIKDAHAAKEIADDAKRIYEAMNGADDIIKTQVRHWAELTDQVKIAREAAEKFSKTSTNIPDVQRAQMQRELDLSAKNAQTGVDDAQFGQKMVTYAQGINNARAALEELNRAHAAGLIVGEDFRKQQESILTTLNSGRLPEAIRLWDELRLPQQQFMRDNAALDSLLHTGAIELDEYTVKLRELQESFDKGGIAKMLNEIDDANKHLQRLVDNYEAGRTTMAQDAARHAADVAHESMIDTKAANIEKQYKVANLDQADLEADLAAWNKRVTAVNANLKALDPLEYATRQHNLMLQEEKKILEQINGAPIKDYQLGIAAANDLQTHGKLNAEQYAQAIDANRLAYLQATPAARTFAGAMEIDWLKAKQGADGVGASLEGIMSTDFGKFNDNMITAITGGGPAAQQTRDQIAKLSTEYARGEVTADEYAKKTKELNQQLSDQTNVWANISSSFSSFVDNMIQDIERLLIKWGEMQLVKGILGAFSGGGGGGGLADTGIGLEGWTGYATGGSFTVGGDGGTDTTPVGFWATRGERVTITPPGAYPYPQAPSPAMYAQGMQPVVHNHIHNHYDSSVVTAAMSSPEGQTTQLNFLRANRSAVRSALGIG